MNYLALYIHTPIQVGSGPSGLVAALTLAKNGIPVRIIEKESLRFPGERGAGVMVSELWTGVHVFSTFPILQPRTLELHKILGTLPEYPK